MTRWTFPRFYLAHSAQRTAHQASASRFLQHLMTLRMVITGCFFGEYNVVASPTGSNPSVVDASANSR